MKKIKLTQGQFSLVDDEDYEFLSQWKWYAHRINKKQTYYAIRTCRIGNQKAVRMHRVIAERYIGKEFKELDHLNRNGLDNQKSNLRVCSRGENIHNTRNTGKYPKGVYLHVKRVKNKEGDIVEYRKYRARININGKTISLGYYKKVEDAEKAYNNGAKKYYPDYTEC
jgi:hypothetical protein